MTMTLLDKSKALLSQNPLPDDADKQLDALVKQADGMEKKFLNMSFEALYAAATPEQLERWNAATDDK